MSNHRKFLIFLCIGGLSTALQMGFLALFVELELLPTVVASFVSYLLSSIFNYFANYHFTFASKSNHTQTLPKYIVAVAIGLSANTILFWIFLTFIHHYLVAQCIATAITLFINFSVQRVWIYRNH